MSYQVTPPLTSRLIRIVVSFCICLFFVTLRTEAKSTETIVVAMYVEPPFSKIIDGEFVGENINVANALAAELGYKTKFVYCPVARCFAFAQSGQADMIIAVRKTAIREQFLHYLEPPIKIQKLPLKFYTLTDNNITLSHYNDLIPLKVGVLRGASYFDPFDHDQQIAKVALSNHQQLMDMLLKGRVDTFLEREESVLPLVDEKIYSTDISIAKYSYNEDVGSYIAIAKQSPLANEVVKLSTALQRLFDSGELATILHKSEK